MCSRAEQFVNRIIGALVELDRWTERGWRTWAADCVEHAINEHDDLFNHVDALRDTVCVVRRHTVGCAADDELSSAQANIQPINRTYTPDYFIARAAAHACVGPGEPPEDRTAFMLDIAKALECCYSLECVEQERLWQARRLLVVFDCTSDLGNISVALDLAEEKGCDRSTVERLRDPQGADETELAVIVLEMEVQRENR